MKRSMLLLLIFSCVTSSAHAATITITRQFLGGDPFDPGPGTTIQLSVLATADAGETSTQVFGELIFTGPGWLIGGSASQTALESFGGAITWVLGTNPCDGNSCTMMNQIGSLSPMPVSNTPLVIAIGTFTVGSVGQVYANWNESTFDFFGVTNAPGICVTCPIPEPATASLLALGLVGLAAARRLRS